MRSILANVVLIGCCLMSCQKTSQAGDQLAERNRSHDQSRGFWVEEEVQPRIQPGMPESEIIRVFGEPSSKSDYGNGIKRLNYLAPVGHPSQARDTGVSAVLVFFKDGKVIDYWTVPSRGSVYIPDKEFKKASVMSHQRTLDSAPELTLHIVNQTAAEGRAYVDTPTLPRLGYISQEPDLRLRRLNTFKTGTTLSVRGGKLTERPTICIHLTAQDAVALKELSSRNLGKHMLFVINRKPLVAPFLRGPISGGVFLVDMESREQLDQFIRVLQQLVENK